MKQLTITWINGFLKCLVISLSRLPFDNGKEFAGWREIANKHDLHTYFAEVGASNQRGLNEKQ